jgi:nicotinamide mononucleotide transporter
MSVFAQILMIRKYWQSWVLWISLDVISIVIYFLKGLYVVSFLYFIFLFMATIGLIMWYKNWVKINSYSYY